jgi:hypothetical protein
MFRTTWAISISRTLRFIARYQMLEEKRFFKSCRNLQRSLRSDQTITSSAAFLDPETERSVHDLALPFNWQLTHAPKVEGGGFLGTDLKC